MNGPVMTTIEKSILETSTIKTISFSFPFEMIPGQFFMVWIPGVDEIPMSVSKIKKNTKSITFKKVGDATKTLFQKKEQDTIGIRGPFGNGFKLEGKKQLYVGGGTGVAMLAPAIKQQALKGAEITVILGAKQKKDLFFKEYLQNYTKNIYVTTDDGSNGYKGYASTFAGQLLQKEKFDNIYTCGPEPMMNALLQQRNNTPLQASLERYMKCGIGLCGQCCIGNGQRVCKDGPIFNHHLLEKDIEFGRHKRDETGRKIPI